MLSEDVVLLKKLVHNQRNRVFAEKKRLDYKFKIKCPSINKINKLNSELLCLARIMTSLPSLDLDDKNYLFICSFGQSRSRWFAEKMMSLGYKAMFCGVDTHADFVLNKNHVNWADNIIVLDSHILYFKNHRDMIEVEGKKMIKFFIDDNPVEFENMFIKLLKVLN